MTKRNRGQDPAKQPFNLPANQINKTGKRKGGTQLKGKKSERNNNH